MGVLQVQVLSLIKHSHKQVCSAPVCFCLSKWVAQLSTHIHYTLTAAMGILLGASVKTLAVSTFPSVCIPYTGCMFPALVGVITRWGLGVRGGLRALTHCVYFFVITLTQHVYFHLRDLTHHNYFLPPYLLTHNSFYPPYLLLCQGFNPSRLLPSQGFQATQHVHFRHKASSHHFNICCCLPFHLFFGHWLHVSVMAGEL